MKPVAHFPIFQKPLFFPVLPNYQENYNEIKKWPPTRSEILLEKMLDLKIVAENLFTDGGGEINKKTHHRKTNTFRMRILKRQ